MSKKILVIDDNHEIVALVKNRLEAQHWDVITATDGVEGFVKAKNHQPDLIVMDVLMPNLDGYSLLGEFKRNLKTQMIPVIILTTRDQMNDLFKQQGIMEEDYLLKPFDGEKLVSRIEKKLVHA